MPQKKYIELTDIIIEMRETKARLNTASKEIFPLAKKKAETERAYRIALRQEKLKLKTEGMPITLINDIAKGNEHIATLRLERDIANDMYKAGLESMRTTQSEASILQSLSKYTDEV